MPPVATTFGVRIVPRGVRGPVCVRLCSTAVAVAVVTALVPAILAVLLVLGGIKAGVCRLVKPQLLFLRGMRLAICALPLRAPGLLRL